MNGELFGFRIHSVAYSDHFFITMEVVRLQGEGYLQEVVYSN
jgi:hypothetical protein